MIKTSTNVARNKSNKAIIISSEESKIILKNFLLPKSCLITATEIIPPASAPTKYAPISSTPWGRYLTNPRPIACTDEYANNFVLMKLPMKAPPTEAFHASMKIAPAPYKKENRMQKINTFTLLKKIEAIYFGYIADPLATEAFKLLIVWCCTLNKEFTTFSGNNTAHNVKAAKHPKNKKTNKAIVLLCSFRSDHSFSIKRSFRSSFLIETYIKWKAANAVKNTMIKLALFLNSRSPIATAIEEYIKPIKKTKSGFFLILS